MFSVDLRPCLVCRSHLLRPDNSIVTRRTAPLREFVILSVRISRSRSFSPSSSFLFIKYYILLDAPYRFFDTRSCTVYTLLVIYKLDKGRRSSLISVRYFAAQSPLLANLPSTMTSDQIAPPFIGFIETTYDALLMFEAARRGAIPRITRRLNDPEKPMIHSGAVFLFDEHESGIKRWTDSIVWSPSRILGNFLVSPSLSLNDVRPDIRCIGKSTVEPTIDKREREGESRPNPNRPFRPLAPCCETCRSTRSPDTSCLATPWVQAHCSTGTTLQCLACQGNESDSSWAA